MQPVGQARGDEGRNLGGGFVAPVGIAQGDHVVDRPGVVSDDVG